MTFDPEQEAAPVASLGIPRQGRFYPLALWGPKGGAVYQNVSERSDRPRSGISGANEMNLIPEMRPIP
jgi:hypothetical protein